jgi:tetratricopeptide (TPR) repeat protein
LEPKSKVKLLQIELRNTIFTMSEVKNQWVIRLDSEQVKGPYSTEAIIKMITSGVFSGSEEICPYPDGEWNALTKQPEFYDALIESLENPVEVDIKKAQKMEAETVIRSVQLKKTEPVKYELPEAIRKIIENERDDLLKQEQLKISQILKPKKTLFEAKINLPVVKKSKSNLNPIFQQRDNNLTIQLSDIKKIQESEKKKFFPFIIILLLVIAGVFYLLNSPADSVSKGWTLVAPQKNTESLSSEEALALKRKAVRAIQIGLMEDILIGHKNLARIVSAFPKDLEAMGLLCMAYEELWPYTKQTLNDLKSIMTVTQMARQVNPISNYSESCQVVFLLTKGQNKEARSLLEKTLDNHNDEKFSLGPFLYFLKGEMLEFEQKNLEAIAYYDQATQLWPQWMLSQFGSARLNFKLGKYNEARTLYLEMTKNDVESKAGHYGLGLVEKVGYKNNEKAFEYFSLGFQSHVVLPKDFHVEALLNYAQILIEKNENKKALKVAQKGYQMNPSHRALKEIVLLLGGDDKVENAQNEIILQGDQFIRAGDHLAAQAQYKAAFDIDPKNANAAYKAAKSLWAINQTKEAVSWLTKAIRADPKMIQAYTLKADYEAQKYNFIEATKTLQEANRISQLNHEVLKGQALLEFRKNNMVGAIQYGERAMKLYDADVELLSILAQASTAFYMNAPGTRKEDLARKDSALADAQRYAGRATDLEPSWPDAQITYARVLAAKEGPLRGEKYLKDMIKSFPYTIEYRIALAEFYKSVEKYAEASDVYAQVFAIDSKNKKASFGLADAYRVMNNPEMAQKYYNITSVLDPSDVEPLFSNAKLLLETASGREARPKIEQAISKLKVVKEINPNFPRVSYYLAKSYMELGDFQLALDLIKEEKTRNPNIADPFLLAAEVFYRKEQFKECAAEYSQAIKMRPSSAELYVKASICYRSSEAIDIAEDMLSIAKQKESGFPEIYREQGFIFEKKGLANDAKEAFEKYLDLAPNAPDRAMIEMKVK